MQVFILNYLLSFYNSVDARARRLHVWWWCFWLWATHHAAMQPPEQVLALVQVPAIANTHRFPLYIFVLLSPIHTRLLVRFIWCLCASALRFSPHSLSRCESFFFFCFSFYSVRFMCSNARACSQMHVRLAYFYFREARANTWKNKTEYRI